MCTPAATYPTANVAADIACNSRLVEFGQAGHRGAGVGRARDRLTKRTFHIGGTASRISDQNTLDARHAGTVHHEGNGRRRDPQEGGQPIDDIDAAVG